MVATKKTKTDTPVVETKTPVKKTKVMKKVTEPVIAAAPVVVQAATPIVVDVVVDAEKTVEDNGLSEASTAFFSNLQHLTSSLTALKAEYRVLEKKWVRELKQSQKVAKKKRKNGNRAPSGFVKPTRISDELAVFLGVEKGIDLARTQVTRDITAYIREHNLQDKDNGRKINPDNKLKTLLQLSDEDTLTYFNLQKYMSPHFAKSIKATEAAAAAAAAAAVATA